jgi:uncharacterized protein YqjF (DUF2071 family)
MRAPASPVVDTAIMIHQWRLMSFLHWSYRPEAVSPLLPAGLRVHTHDGLAWVSMTPFEMRGVRTPGVPAMPWLSRFPETNVRTYVRGPDGGVGIFFFSLDAGRLPAVLAAQAGLRLPYRWAATAVRTHGDCLSYRGRRRWPGPPGAGYSVRVRPRAALREDELDPLDHFLTARFRLYSMVAGRLVAVDVQHPPWPLHRATLLELRQDLLTAAGLPAPQGEPLLHASPGVRVRIGWPRAVVASAHPTP